MKKFATVVLTLYLVFLLSNIAFTFLIRSSRQDNSSQLLEDAVLKVPQLLVKYGYPCEIHEVETLDGYLLDIHRIPNKDGIPVLLSHGITDSSAGWVMFGPEKGLGYMLAELGYDVWMFNARGTRYSRKHKRLSTKSFQFWDFSFHEIGTFDLPATFDHIRNQTGYEKIHYIGWSQGCTVYFIMCSEMPGYCNRVIIMNAMAPAVFIQNSRSPLIRVLSKFIFQLEGLALLTGIKEFEPTNALLAASGLATCRDRAPTQKLCVNSIFLIYGYDSDQLNTTSIPIMNGHMPAGVSTKQLLHFGQWVRSGKFIQYEYGPIRNYVVYGQRSPPSYDLSKATAPVAIQYGLNDWLTVPQDVKHFASLLPNLVEIRQVPHPKFSHGDFIFAIDVRKLVYEDVIRIMQEAENKYGVHPKHHINEDEVDVPLKM